MFAKNSTNDTACLQNGSLKPKASACKKFSQALIDRKIVLFPTALM